MGPAWLVHGEVLNSSSSYDTKIRGILYSSLRGVVVTLLHSMNGQMSNCKTAEILRKKGTWNILLICMCTWCFLIPKSFGKFCATVKDELLYWIEVMYIYINKKKGKCFASKCMRKIPSYSQFNAIKVINVLTFTLFIHQWH